MAVRGIPFTLSTQEDVMVPITGSPSSFIGIDFDAQSSTIFFSDTAKDIIYKQKIDGTGEEACVCVCVDIFDLFFTSTTNYSFFLLKKEKNVVFDLLFLTPLLCCSPYWLGTCRNPPASAS